MTLPRTLIVSVAIALFAIPFSSQAKIGLQPGFENIHRSAPEQESEVQQEEEPEPKLSTGALLKLQEYHEKMNARRERTGGFWQSMMNYRKAENAFRKQHQIRKEKRKEKRLQCRKDIRKANRDAILRETLHCFRATLSQDLEILRKERQYIENLPGSMHEYRQGALFHSQNLSDAISTVLKAIDAGVYESKEGVQDAKRNLAATYRVQKRLAMTRLRIDRSISWLQHLAIRLDDILNRSSPPQEVISAIKEAISCLEQKEGKLRALLPMEDNDALIESFRQVQSESKFCIDLAREAHGLNTELEQATAENE